MSQIIVFIIVFVGYIYLINKKIYPSSKSERIITWSSFIVLFVLAGFRDFSIHNDTIPYIQHFMESVHDGPFWKIDKTDRFEPGYQMYENFVHLYIADNPVAFNVISAFVVLLAFYTFSKKYCENMAYLIVLYFVSCQYFSQIGVLRQSLAVVCFYGVYICIDKKKYILSVAFLLLALSMHHSSTLLILTYACFYFKPNSKNIKIILILSIIVFFTYSTFLNQFADESRYLAESEAKGFFNLTGLTSFLNSIAYIWVIYRLRGYVEKQPKDEPMLMISVLYCIVALLSIRIWIFVRFSMFFVPIILIYISNLTNRVQNKRAYFYLTLYLITSFLLLLSARPEWFSIYPYKFVDGFNINVSNIY